MTSVSLLFLSLISQCRDFWLKNHPVEVQCYGRGAVVTLVLKLRISDAVGGLNACRGHGVQGTRGAGDTGCRGRGEQCVSHPWASMCGDTPSPTVTVFSTVALAEFPLPGNKLFWNCLNLTERNIIRKADNSQLLYQVLSKLTLVCSIQQRPLCSAFLSLKEVSSWSPAVRRARCGHLIPTLSD